MRNTLLVGGGLALALVGIIAVYLWSERDPGSAWVIVDPEQVVYDVKPEQAVHVLFHLQNTSSRPCRIVGHTAC
jgi:hypothetical protein